MYARLVLEAPRSVIKTLKTRTPSSLFPMFQFEETETFTRVTKKMLVAYFHPQSPDIRDSYKEALNSLAENVEYKIKVDVIDAESFNYAIYKQDELSFRKMKIINTTRVVAEVMQSVHETYYRKSRAGKKAGYEAGIKTYNRLRKRNKYKWYLTLREQEEQYFTKIVTDLEWLDSPLMIKSKGNVRWDFMLEEKALRRDYPPTLKGKVAMLPRR